jgi:hypothetical protein
MLIEPVETETSPYASALYQDENGHYLFRYGIPSKEKCLTIAIGRFSAEEAAGELKHFRAIMEEVSKHGGNAALLIDENKFYQGSTSSGSSAAFGGNPYGAIMNSSSSAVYSDETKFFILYCE